VPIESAGGRAEYASAQRSFADRAAVLRGRLLAAIDRFHSRSAVTAGGQDPRE
jgi:hypothetical protein